MGACGRHAPTVSLLEGTQDGVGLALDDSAPVVPDVRVGQVRLWHVELSAHRTMALERPADFLRRGTSHIRLADAVYGNWRMIEYFI